MNVQIREKSGKTKMHILITVLALALFACLLILLQSCQKSEALNLTLDGEANGVIMIAENASEMEEYAARELQEHILLVSKAYLPIVRGNPDKPSDYTPLSTENISATELADLKMPGKGGGVTLFLATPDSFPALTSKYADDLAFLDGSDGFAIRQKRKVIYILGAKAGGVLNGVYNFIETNLGVLWTRSIELGTLYDPVPTITADKVNYREKSPFEIRGWHLCGTGAGGEPHSDPGTEIMMSRNKLNAKFAEFSNVPYWDWQNSIGIEPVNLGHSLHHWLKTSPYYQSLSDEKKDACWNTDTQGNPTVDMGHLNFWNPDVAVAIAESVNNFIDANRINYVGVGIEDTQNFRQTPEDKQPFEYAEGEFVAPRDPKFLSTVFYSFMNDVARRVKAEHPEAKLTTFSYLFTETPPYVKLEDNITIVIAPIFEDMNRLLTDPESYSNNRIKENMLEWAQSTNNVFVYNYYGCFPNACEDVERPIAKRIQADLRFYTEQGFKGLLPEGHVDNGTDMWAVGPLTMWLYSKLAWNPDADIDELTRLFCEKAYGDAAEDMLEYYRLLQESWDLNSASVSWNNPTYFYIGRVFQDKDRNALMQEALSRAWAVAGDTQKQRIEPIREAFKRLMR